MSRVFLFLFFFSSRRRHTRFDCDWSSDVCSSDLLLKKLNQRHLAQTPDDSELAARIESFELAYRMQMAAPECLDLERESQATQRLYGLDNPKCAHIARQCLIARRLVERG